MAAFTGLERGKYNSVPFLRLIAVSLALGAAWILLSNAKVICNGIQSGMSLCVEVVIPSLFPFMVFTTFLTLSGLADMISRIVSPATRWLFRLPRQAGAAVLMSFIGGFPVGGRMTAKLIQNKSISPEDGQRMLCFCINAGPSFILTAVGAQMFGNRFIGMMMLTAHLLASCTAGVISSLGKSIPPSNSGSRKMVRLSFTQAFIQAVIDSANGMLVLCSFIILFSGLTAWLEPVAMQFGETVRLSLGILEVTKGCLQASAFPGLLGELTAVFLLSFSGLSVIAQVLAGFTAEGLPVQPIKVILWRMLNGVCAVGWYFVIRTFLGKFLLKAEPVFLRISQQKPSLASRPLTLPLTFCLIAVCAITILTAESSFSSSTK